MPDFQRDFVWEPSRVVDFLESVANSWPTGALLFLEAPPHGVRPLFNAKEFKDGPTLKGGLPDYFVLDGQQRLTALYHAYFDSSTDTVYYADSNSVGSADIIRAATRKRAEFKLSQPGTALIQDIVGIAPRSKRLPSATDKLSNAVEALRRELPGMRPGEYNLPVVVVPWDVELAALAKIFETVNRSGVKLNAFDLMVAILFPQGFNLREEWIAAQSKYESLVQFEIDGVQVLQLIALWKRAEEIAANKTPRVRGIRQSDVLRVPGGYVEQEWDHAVSAFDEAIKFGSERLGIVNPMLVPSDSMLLTAASLLHAVKVANVEAWFWGACLTQAYAQGTNTQVVADFDHEGLNAAEAADPAEIQNLLRQPLARNGIAARGLCCALVKSGARDMLTGQPLANIAPSIELQIKSLAELWGGDQNKATVGEVMILTKGSLPEVKAALDNRESRVMENLHSQQLGKLRFSNDRPLKAMQEEAQMERIRFYSSFIRRIL